MENENKKNLQPPKKEEKPTIEQIKKAKAKAETAKFKSKYFEYYDDIKISDRQDW
ncbi:MAG: hypothetical protein IKV61_02670 [Clostridia bacterium]|nr:hypothetical protein [Clostridia bacterium]